jgi:CheY-like chemotaxis protein
LKTRVLIVDDDSGTRHLLALMFAVEGFDIVGEAENGLEAVRMAVETQPDLIVLDYRMPVMRGDEAAHLLRALVPDSRIIAFSSILDSKPAWADAFLNKSRVEEIMPLMTRMAPETIR